MTGWNPKRKLPPDWGTRRRLRLEYDKGRCQLRLERICIGTATEVHHAGDPTDHRLAALVSVCAPCHEHETRLQSASASRALWKQIRPRPRKHPGLL